MRLIELRYLHKKPVVLKLEVFQYLMNLYIKPLKLKRNFLSNNQQVVAIKRLEKKDFLIIRIELV